MADRTPVEIPYSQLEYVVTFEKPMLDLAGKFHDLVAPFMDALEPWGFVFEESEFLLTSPRPRDHVVTFHRPSTAPPPQMRVAVRWSTLTVSVDQPDWTEAESIAKLCSAAVETALHIANAKIESQQISLGMHVQSKTTQRSEITALLLTAQARELMDGQITGQGIILHREGSMIVIDNSAVFANGLFIRIQRTFDHSVGIAQISETLLKDERKLWDLLGLEGEL